MLPVPSPLYLQFLYCLSKLRGGEWHRNPRSRKVEADSAVSDLAEDSVESTGFSA
ncbi:hypothetical protein CDL15_Pgr018876 [Punica granatum]|uniref:Uncharacterized protein n=1 Tax=Punica granatum TaxID=22663 RepID=A0A218VUS4_PUNGR|nr:hypothetical protein CDL15_Pgr018876 [Punica granatum]